MQDENMIPSEMAEFSQHRCLIKTSTINITANMKRMANRSPDVCDFLAPEELGQSVTSTDEAGQNGVCNIFDIWILPPWQTGRQDQMVEYRLDRGHDWHCQRFTWAR
jgi:hypothetical protein